MLYPQTLKERTKCLFEPGPNPIQIIFNVKLYYAHFERSDWLFKIFQPISAPKADVT